MKLKMLVIPCICAVLLLALVLPASADDASQVTVTPTATIISPPAFDPLGSLESILGLRHEDQNLTQNINANDQEIHQNWWDSLNIIQDILGNHATVSSDQAADLENRSANIGYREDIHADQQDIRNDSGNQTAEEQQIASDRADIHQDWQGNAATHQDIQDERNASQQDWSQINANRQDDASLRQDNGADREQIQDNRQQIRDDRGNASSS